MTIKDFTGKDIAGTNSNIEKVIFNGNENNIIFAKFREKINKNKEKSRIRTGYCIGDCRYLSFNIRCRKPSVQGIVGFA